MYAGDFADAAAQARRLVEQDAGFFKNYLPLANAASAGMAFLTSAERATSA